MGIKGRSNALLTRRIGLKIHKFLYENKCPPEVLAFKSGVARSTLREIIAGRSNPRILTLNTIAKRMGYSGLGEFLLPLENDNLGNK